MAAFDIDGTLTDGSGSFDIDALEVLRDLNRRGVLVIVATARGPSGVAAIAEALEGRLCAVTYQGALVGAFDDGHWVTHSETTLEIDLAHEITDLAAESGLPTSWHAGLSWHVTALTSEILMESTIVNDSPQLVEDHRQLLTPPHKLMFISPSDETWRLAELAAHLPPSVSYAYSHPNYLELSPCGIDKGSGLDGLLVEVGGSGSDLAAFGDGENDIAMFELAAHSVAMAHAPATVRDAATEVATDGLVEVIRRIRWRPFHQS